MHVQEFSLENNLRPVLRLTLYSLADFIVWSTLIVTLLQAIVLFVVSFIVKVAAQSIPEGPKHFAYPLRYFSLEGSF